MFVFLACGQTQKMESVLPTCQDLAIIVCEWVKQIQFYILLLFKSRPSSSLRSALFQKCRNRKMQRCWTKTLISQSDFPTHPKIEYVARNLCSRTHGIQYNTKERPLKSTVHLIFTAISELTPHCVFSLPAGFAYFNFVMVHGCRLRPKERRLLSKSSKKGTKMISKTSPK